MKLLDKNWKRGIVFGFIWGVVGMFMANLLVGILTNQSSFFVKFIHYVLGFPTYMALFLGFHFYLIFIGSPLIGIITGALIGFLMDKSGLKIPLPRIKITKNVLKGALIGFGIAVVPLLLFIVGEYVLPSDISGTLMGFLFDLYNSGGKILINIWLIPGGVVLNLAIAFGIIRITHWFVILIYLGIANVIAWVILGALLGFLYDKFNLKIHIDKFRDYFGI